MMTELSAELRNIEYCLNFLIDVSSRHKKHSSVTRIVSNSSFGINATNTDSSGKRRSTSAGNSATSHNNHKPNQQQTTSRITVKQVIRSRTRRTINAFRLISTEDQQKLIQNFEENNKSSSLPNILEAQEESNQLESCSSKDNDSSSEQCSQDLLEESII